LDWITWLALYLTVGLILGIIINARNYQQNRDLPKSVGPDSIVPLLLSIAVITLGWPLIVIGEFSIWLKK